MIAFTQTLGAAIALVIGIVTLVIAVWSLSRLAEWLRGTSGKILIAQDFIRKDALVSVKTTGNEVHERVKFLGFSKPQSTGSHGVPFPFSRMAVFENEARERIFIPSTHIQFIKELPNSTTN